MNASVLEAEVVEPRGESFPRPRVAGVGALGVLGAALAILTTFAALGVTMLMLFGTTLASALLVWALWPAVFSPELTQWTFGTPYAPFWKLFALFLATGFIVKLFRPLGKR